MAKERDNNLPTSVVKAMAENTHLLHKGNQIGGPPYSDTFLKWTSPGLFFVYFRSCQIQILLEKNCRLQRDSNSDRRSMRLFLSYRLCCNTQ